MCSVRAVLLNHAAQTGALIAMQVLLNEAEACKASGNQCFKDGDYASAIQHYDKALKIAPPGVQERSVYFANSAACHLALENWSDCVNCCTEALGIDATYVKALRRRMTAFEKLDDLDRALADAKQVRFNEAVMTGSSAIHAFSCAMMLSIIV